MKTVARGAAPTRRRVTWLFDLDNTLHDASHAASGQHRPKPDVRMFRHVLARLKRLPARCVVVEDTLSRQKAACSIGLRTVWMQGYLGATSNPGRSVGAGRKPAYVCARIKRIQGLRAIEQFAR